MKEVNKILALRLLKETNNRPPRLDYTKRRLNNILRKKRKNLIGSKLIRSFNFSQMSEMIIKQMDNDEILKVKEINGSLFWIQGFLRDSKVHFILSSVYHDSRPINIVQTPKHRNIDLLDFNEEIERINIKKEHGLGSVYNVRMNEINQYYLSKLS